MIKIYDICFQKNWLIQGFTAVSSADMDCEMTSLLHNDEEEGEEGDNQTNRFKYKVGQFWIRFIYLMKVDQNDNLTLFRLGGGGE